MKSFFLFLLPPLSSALALFLLAGRVRGVFGAWLTVSVFFLAFYPFQADLERRRAFSIPPRERAPKFWRFALASFVGGLIISLLFFVAALTKQLP